MTAPADAPGEGEVVECKPDAWLYEIEYPDGISRSVHFSPDHYPWEKMKKGGALSMEISCLYAHRAKLTTPPATPKEVVELVGAARRLSFAAQITGGVAGRDENLCEAIDGVTAALAPLRQHHPGESLMATELPALPEAVERARKAYRADWEWTGQRVYFPPVEAQPIDNASEPMESAIQHVDEYRMTVGYTCEAGKGPPRMVVVRADDLDAIMAAATRHPAPTAEGDWLYATVPYEPTPEMLTMFWHVCTGGSEWMAGPMPLTKKQLARAKLAYAAMLATAPARGVVVGEEVVERAARELSGQAHPSAPGWETLSEAIKTAYRETARAALTAALVQP